MNKTAIEKLRTIKRNMELTYHYCEKCGEADPSTNDDTYTEICDLLAAIEAEKPADEVVEIVRMIRTADTFEPDVFDAPETWCINRIQQFASAYHAEQCKDAADRAVSFVDNNYNAMGEWDDIAFDNLRAAIMGGKA